MHITLDCSKGVGATWQSPSARRSEGEGDRGRGESFAMAERSSGAPVDPATAGFDNDITAAAESELEGVLDPPAPPSTPARAEEVCGGGKPWMLSAGGGGGSK